MTPAEETPRVESVEPPQRFDPDLDPPPPRLRRRRRRSRVPRDCQRLVANPFLGLVVFFGGISLIGQAMFVDGMPLTPLAIGAFAIVGLSIYLLHFHCLDCGKTRWLFRWRYHSCPAVADRQRMGTGRLIPGPSPVTQTLLWTMLMCIAVMVVAIIEFGSR